jgi:hypothetical protein
MRRLVVLSLPLLVCFSACTGGDRRNASCEWPQETAISLDLRNPEQQRHLSDDALLAEDLAIRYADSGKGLGSGHSAGSNVYERTRDECMAALFSTIAKNHGVTLEQVRDSLLQRRTSFDAAVLISFAAFYWLVAYRLARRVCRRFPLRESWPTALVSTVGTSVLVSFVGVLMGEVWAGWLEGIRLGNDHLSYRAFRIPWGQHRMGLFVAGLFLFWLAAALRYRAASRDAEVPGG